MQPFFNKNVIFVAKARYRYFRKCLVSNILYPHCHFLPTSMFITAVHPPYAKCVVAVCFYALVCETYYVLP